MTATTAQQRIERRFDAGADDVFDAWLDVQKVRQWFAPGFGPVVCVDIAPRIGGAFCFVQDRGGEDVEWSGEYLEIDRPHRLAFTWRAAPADTSRVAVDIVPLGSGCELTLVHERNGDTEPHASAAWRSMLDAMAASLR